MLENGWGESGELLPALARRLGTPLYVYHRPLIRDRLAELRRALATTGCRFRIHYALKANRYSQVVSAIRAERDIAIDACSPREVALARTAGFTPAEISVTCSMPSNRDLAAFATAGIHVNLDTMSAIRRFGAVAPAGTRIGLRLDPGFTMGYDGRADLAYGNGKFGLAEDQIPAALASAATAGLVVDTLHMHCGWNLQRAALPQFEAGLALLARVAEAVPATVINVGGGLGTHFRPDDDPLLPLEWAAALARHLGPLRRMIACEPGTFVVADAGLLLVEVNTVERRGDSVWVGVNAGHTINVYAAHYGIPLAMAVIGRAPGPVQARYTVAGNINEANDIFARDILLPELHEGDLLALFPAGAYGSSMASDHCLRGEAGEVMIE